MMVVTVATRVIPGGVAVPGGCSRSRCGAAEEGAHVEQQEQENGSEPMKHAGKGMSRTAGDTLQGRERKNCAPVVAVGDQLARHAVADHSKVHLNKLVPGRNVRMFRLWSRDCSGLLTPVSTSALPRNM